MSVCPVFHPFSRSFVCLFVCPCYITYALRVNEWLMRILMFLFKRTKKRKKERKKRKEKTSCKPRGNHLNKWRGCPPLPYIYFEMIKWVGLVWFVVFFGERKGDGSAYVLSKSLLSSYHNTDIHTIYNWSLQSCSQEYWPSFSHHLCCVC